MEQKKKEKDVLIVRDEKTGEISVVAGLDKDGNPKRTPAKAENAQDFLQFDRHGDVLDNFFKNFVRQCKEPSRFGFYRVAADQPSRCGCHGIFDCCHLRICFCYDFGRLSAE